jgi:predicted acetyltransferase
MRALEIRAPENDDALGEFAPIVGWAFNDTPENSLRWLQRSKLEDLRLARSGGRVVGGLAQIPMGQWFGGQRVSTLGIAGVAVAASARGSGVALGMMSFVLDEARRAGFALSTLYPSTVALYRQVDYELAGSYCRTKLRLSDLARMKTAASASTTIERRRPWSCTARAASRGTLSSVSEAQTAPITICG